MPTLLRRLWTAGRRRAARAEAAPAADARSQADEAEVKRRLEEARRRLKQTIPPPEDQEPPA